MTPRLEAPFKLAPDAYKAMTALEVAVKASGLEHSLIELVKMRASQINGCAFCIHMHSTDARKAGETEMRLYMLNAWRESSLYTPRERAAFLLHDVFGIPLDDVALTVEREPAAVRQLAARARRHVQDARPRYTVARDEGSRIAEAFFVATRSGDTKALRSILAQNVVVRSDGGGKVLAFLNPIIGLERVLRLYKGLARKLGFQKANGFRPMRIDGLPGYVSYERDNIFQTTAFAIEDGKITEIYITRNPDKLRHVMQALTASGPADTRH